MESASEVFVDIELPPVPDDYDVLFGVPVSPIDRLKLLSPEQFEHVVCEWANGYLKKEYVLVYRCGSAGDKGRDVVARLYNDSEHTEWDNYQCKHYDHPLHPGDIWLELGKLCYYTYIRSYTVPRKYIFVSSCGVGTTLAELIENPIRLKEELISNWDGKCKSKITKTVSVELAGEFLNYVINFDFSIIAHCPPQQLLEQYSKTPFYKYRFGGGLSKPRPKSDKPQQSIQSNEMKYVKKLYGAYSDYLGEDIADSASLNKHETLLAHFNGQREDFYKAESLRRFARDELPHDEPFEKLQDEIYRGVIDIVEDEHPNGYACVKETIKEARRLAITSNILIKYVDLGDRSGICHQLANKDKIDWVKK